MDILNAFMFLNSVNNQSKLLSVEVVDLKNLMEDLNTFINNNFDVYFIGRILYI